MIRKEGDFWVLRSRETGRVLGRHKTKKKAVRQEKAIRMYARGERRVKRKHRRMLREDAE